jgi:hypothetical protein
MTKKQTSLDLNGPILSFTQQPQSVTVDNDSTVTFTGIATAFFPNQSPANPSTNTGTLSYRWHAEGFGPLNDGSFRGATLTGTGTTILNVSNVKSPDTHPTNFFLTVDYIPSAYSQPSGSAVTVGTARSTGNAINDILGSNNASLNVRPFITITSQPVETTTATGGQAIFNVDAILSDDRFGSLSYQWQLNGQNLNDQSSPLIRGSKDKTLIISPSSLGSFDIRAVVTNPSAQQVISNVAKLNAVNPRPIIVFEAYTPQNTYERQEVNLDQVSNFTLTDTTFGSNTNVITFYASERNIDTEMEIRTSKGSDVGSFAGGNGGLSRIRVNLVKDIEYAVLGVPNNRGIFLYRGSNLISVVGRGGDAGSSGNGGAGGGVSNAGSNGSGTGAGIGGSRFTAGQLTTSGIFGSNSNILIQNILTGDSKASIPNGGRTISCSKGSYWIQQGISPCSNNGLTQFRNTDGTLISQSGLITRGFKPGYTVTATDGKLTESGGNGGNGATGGSGGSAGGGGGGSGYTDGSVSVLSSTAGGNSSFKSTINFKVYVPPPPPPQPAPQPAPPPPSCSQRYYDYRYGGAAGSCPQFQSRRGQWFEANDGNWYPVVPRTQSNMNDVQNVYVNTLNRPGGVFEIETGVTVFSQSGATGLRNYLLSRETRRSVAPRTRCDGFNYFGSNLPGTITYCSQVNAFTLLGPASGTIRTLG